MGSVHVICKSAGYSSFCDIFSRRSESFLNSNLQSTNQQIMQLTIVLVAERIENERLLRKTQIEGFKDLFPMLFLSSVTHQIMHP